MAVLAPVLERKVNTEENITTERSSEATMTAEERHNSRIKFNYAKLINPDNTIDDVIYTESVPQQHVAEPVARDQKPILVESARTHSEVFCADSRINRKQAEVNAAQEEEENEDLRPSAETIKYKSGAASKVVIEDNISNKQTRVSKFTKRDKIIMAVALLVIVALFVLVIVNSAVLSNLNNEVSYLKNDLVTAQQNYTEVLESKEAYLDNIEQTVIDFAAKSGMVKI